MFDKLFWALARRRAKRIAIALKIDNKYTCTSNDVRAIIGMCRLTGFSDGRIKEIVLNVGEAA
jgi:hypothetical protein